MTEPKEVTPEKAPITMRDGFVRAVSTEFCSSGKQEELNDFQKRLIVNYFNTIEITLKDAEEKRVKQNVGKSEKFQNQLPYTWANVNTDTLKKNLVAAARIGYDPAQKNHINMLPFKKGDKYEITFIEGYKGIELKAQKYGLDYPSGIVVEVVYSNDSFKPIKKDHRNKVENYEFEIANPFDRGEIIGGFYYKFYTNNPEKNKLVTLSMKDIEKRKPSKASPEFWGGEKDEWKNGQKTGKKEHVEGWKDEMVYKTICRAAYNSITIDSTKIDNDYAQLRQNEQEFRESEVINEIAENANTEAIDITSACGEQGEVIIDEVPAADEQPSPKKPGPGF